MVRLATSPCAPCLRGSINRLPSWRYCGTLQRDEGWLEEVVRVVAAAEVEAQARALIEGFAGEAAFLARHLGTGEAIGYRPDRAMPTASTIKLLVLAEL